jgi:hypothetical protein
MRKFYAACVVLALGCSSSGSNPGNGAVDPASLDFCLEWANGVCRLAYLCVDAGAQDSAFHSRYGSSKDDCWQSVEKYCTSNQTGSQTFGPSCGAGKEVNDDLASACTESLETATCADWTAAPAGTCGSVCNVARNGGAGGSPGAGGSGSGGTGTGAAGMSSGGSGASTGSLSTPSEFCIAAQSATCDRIFECNAAAAAALFGTVADCKTTTTAECTTRDLCLGGYDATKAAGCMSELKGQTCQQLQGEVPAVCSEACK